MPVEAWSVIWSGRGQCKDGTLNTVRYTEYHTGYTMSTTVGTVARVKSYVTDDDDV